MNIIRLDNKYYESKIDFDRLMSESKIHCLAKDLILKNPGIINNEVLTKDDIIIGCADPEFPVMLTIKNKYRFELEILGWDRLDFGFECIWEEGELEELREINNQILNGDIKIEK